MSRSLLVAVVSLLVVSSPAVAQQRTARGSSINSECPAFYLGAQSPRVVSAPARRGRIICHSFYVIEYSTQLRNPVWTSYRLTRAMAQGGDRIGRYRGNFRQEPGLTPAEQGHHRDYVNPPFDRGHLTPANDAQDMEAQRDTFVITNVVPQISELNQGLWRFLEASVHQLAINEGEVYVVTGANFSANPPLMRSRSNGRRRVARIAVPEETYKAIYVPSLNIAVAYIATNQVAAICTIVSVEELTRRTGINPFPTLPHAIVSQQPNFTLPAGLDTPPPNCHPRTVQAPTRSVAQ